MRVAYGSRWPGEALGSAQPGAASAAIAGHLPRVRALGVPVEQPQHGAVAASALWQPGRTDAVAAFPLQELLHLPILQRVVGDHHETSAWCEQIQGSRQNSVQAVELLVYLQTQRLEGTRGRMGTHAVPVAHGGGHNVGQHPGRLNGAARDNGPSDGSSGWFFAAAADEIREILLSKVVEEVVGREGGVRVEPHVGKGRRRE